MLPAASNFGTVAMMRRLAVLIVFGLLIVDGTACSNSRSKKANPPPPTVKQVEVAKLPELGHSFSPFADGRLRVAGPKGWYTSPRSKAYVCQFTFSKRPLSVPLPRIRILVEPAVGESWDKWKGGEPVDPKAFAAAIAEHVKSKPLLEPVLPMVIGSHPCARYVDAAKFQLRQSNGSVKSVKAHRQVIYLLHDRQLYRIELHVAPGRILNYRDQAYAVVAGLKFADDSPEKNGPAEEKKPVEGEEGGAAVKK